MAKAVPLDVVDVPLDVAAVQLYGYIGTTHEQNSEAYSVHGILVHSYPE